MYGETCAVCQVCVLHSGLNARPCFKPVTTPCLYVARLRVVVVSLAVEGLITVISEAGTIHVVAARQRSDGPLLR